MSQQLRDVLHLIVGKLSVASEAEAQALHDLVDEALPEEKGAVSDTAPAADAGNVVPATPGYVAPPAG